MERILITIGNKEDLANFEECVATQNEWAQKHNVEHTIVEIENVEESNWDFYKTFISYFLQNENKIVIAITPAVMILETFNPLQIVQPGIVSNIGQTSFLMGKYDGSPVVKMILEKSLNFKDVKNINASLALEVIALKTENFIFFLKDLVVKPNYPKLMQKVNHNGVGFEIHADTNKNNKFKISYNKLENSQIYKGGEFAVDLQLNNLDLSKGFIVEFKKLKDKILEIYGELQDLYQDLK